MRDQLLQHPMYKELTTPDRVRVFMKHHVFAVWDFMSLLKRLQGLLTVTSVPWMPGRDAQYARFINEIVLGEETDEDGHGGFVSHFDLYVQAMEQCGADVGPMRTFLAQLETGKSVEEALRAAEVPESVAAFVNKTMEIAMQGKAHEVAAAFFFGREDIIPDMFAAVVDEIEAKGGAVDRLVYYMRRHIELDGDEHGPLARKLLDHLCAGDPGRIEEAERTAQESLQKRIALWDGVWEEIQAIEGGQ